ncbi:MAG: SRPBCC family protein [Acidimicrobiia bacterium]
MAPTPTAELHATDAGRDLVLVREFRAPIDDVWKSLTTPEGVGPWFGTWSGTPTVGDTVEFTMTAEEGDATSAMTITACTPPEHVAITNADEYGAWHLEARLREADGITTLEFVHHLTPDAPIGEVGAGWEYYLDRLVASRTGAPMPDFDDYYPSMQSYFEHLPAR